MNFETNKLLAPSPQKITTSPPPAPGGVWKGPQLELPPAFKGQLDIIRNGVAEGWAFSPITPGQRLRVELWAGDVFLALGFADRFRPDLARAGFGDGSHAFRIPLPADLLPGRAYDISARIAGEEQALAGSPVTITPPGTDLAGGIAGLVGITIRYFVVTPDSKPAEIQLFLDGISLARHRLDAPQPGIPDNLAVDLPPHCMDGQVHWLRLIDCATGACLGGASIEAPLGPATTGRPAPADVASDGHEYVLAAHLVESYPAFYASAGTRNAVARFWKEGHLARHVPSPLFHRYVQCLERTGFLLPIRPDHWLSDERTTGGAAFDPYVYALASITGGIADTPIFSTAHYLRSNPDVVEAGMNAHHHFIEDGHKEPRRTSVSYDAMRAFAIGRGWFDPEAPAHRHKDSTADGFNLFLAHWDRALHGDRDIHEAFGQAAGDHAPAPASRAHAGFLEACSGTTVSGWVWDRADPARRLDVEIRVDGETFATVVAEWFRKDLLEAGFGDGKYGFYFESTAPLDGRQVSACVTDDGQALPVLEPDPASADNQAGHDEAEFLPRADEIGRVLDRSWYERTYPDVRQSNLDPLQHYLRIGLRKGRDPNPFFLGQWYAQQHLAGAAGPVPPLLHYLDQGAAAGLAPHPLFHPGWYAAQHADFAALGRSHLEHYLAVGLAKGVATTPIFDAGWYLGTYPKAKASGLNAFYHYVTEGGRLGHNPNEFFDADFYTAQHPGLRTSGDNPLIHYLTIGAAGNSDPSKKFSTSGYLKAYRDVAQARLNPLEHFMRSGRREGRSPLGATDGRGADAGRLPIFARFGGTEYGPIAKVIPYASQAPLPARLPRVCVHLHLYHGDLADTFIACLGNLAFGFTLLLSVREGGDRPWRETFMSRLPHVTECVVRQVPNIGRDVAPWVVGFAAEILEHDLFYHCHTKKSDYEPRLFDWRRFLVHNTIGSPGVVAEILGLFDADPALGLVYPPYFPELAAQPRWGGNREKAHALAARMNLPPPDRCPDYPAGSFFWAKVDHLRPLLTCGLRHEDFDGEAAQIDNTLAHAIERLLGELGRASGTTKLCATVDVGYNLVNFWDARRQAASEPLLRVAPAYETRVEKLNDPRRIAVYTCVTGGFDEFVRPAVVHPDVDYFIFSDVEPAECLHYRYQPCRYQDPNPRRTARFVKTHPHMLLSQYDITIWIDANIVLTSSLAPFLATVDGADADLGVIFHATRTSYVEEAQECAKIGADDRETLEEQTTRYKALGVPQSDLIETNFLIAQVHRPHVRKFFNAWWREISRYSLRDQVSVNYAAGAEGCKTVSLLAQGRTVRDDGRFVIFDHQVKDRTSVVSSALSAGKI